MPEHLKVMYELLLTMCYLGYFLLHNEKSSAVPVTACPHEWFVSAVWYRVRCRRFEAHQHSACVCAHRRGQQVGKHKAGSCRTVWALSQKQTNPLVLEGHVPCQLESVESVLCSQVPHADSQNLCSELHWNISTFNVLFHVIQGILESKS